MKVDTLHMIKKYQPNTPGDIRAEGWLVAVHNDYHLNEKFHTFWLFTKDDRAVKGEGESDEHALNQVRKKIGLPEIWF